MGLNGRHANRDPETRDSPATMPTMITETFEAMGEQVLMVLCDHGTCPSLAAHGARIKREGTVSRSSMEMNRRGIDFQPGQEWKPYGGVRNRTVPSQRKPRARKARNA